MSRLGFPNIERCRTVHFWCMRSTIFYHISIVSETMIELVND